MKYISQTVTIYLVTLGLIGSLFTNFMIQDELNKVKTERNKIQKTLTLYRYALSETEVEDLDAAKVFESTPAFEKIEEQEMVEFCDSSYSTY